MLRRSQTKNFISFKNGLVYSRTNTKQTNIPKRVDKERDRDSGSKWNGRNIFDLNFFSLSLLEMDLNRKKIRV